MPSKRKKTSARVAVVMGSDSDLPVMRNTVTRLGDLGLSCVVRVLSAHRSPDAAARFARDAAKQGIRVIIAAAGGAAHLAGTLAAHTTLPVIGVPLVSGDLGGLDALLATVQMPSGVPVATVAVGRAGAANAAVLAAQILALSDSRLARHLAAFKHELAAGVAARDRRVQEELTR
jgi:phosphoribosylaminoimidazole carboxylase PurE protein